MRSRIIFYLKYLRYRIRAKHYKGFGVHSPFLYKLLSDVVFDYTPYYSQNDIMELRKDLKKNDYILEVKDMGAGSKVFKTNSRKIKDIVKHSIVNVKFGELLFRLVVYFQPKTILELGTSLGIGTLYLAKPESSATIYTIEGCPVTAGIASINFELLKARNIKPFVGSFDEKLPEILKEVDFLDFVYFDGNHKKEATLKYFNLCLTKSNINSIFVFDDIHWSKEMEEAWEEIKQNPSVRLTIDLFFFGLVIFKDELSKQDFIVKF